MDTRGFRHFLAVYQHASMGRAAEALRLTQPALSKSIRQLERDLEVTLFERTPRGVIPTAFGEALALHARVIQSELSQAKSTLAGLRGASRGKVRVGIGPSMAPALMPDATLRLMQTHPDISLLIVEGLVDELLPALRRGEIDLAIGSWPRPTDADLSAETLCTDEVRVLGAADHPLAGRRVHPTELLAYPWVLPPENQRWRQHMTEQFLVLGVTPPEPRVVSNCGAYINALLTRGQFLTFLPSQIIPHDRIAPIDVELRIPVEVTLTYRARIRRPPPVQSVIALMKELTGSAATRAPAAA